MLIFRYFEYNFYSLSALQSALGHGVINQHTMLTFLRNDVCVFIQLSKYLLSGGIRGFLATNPGHIIIRAASRGEPNGFALLAALQGGGKTNLDFFQNNISILGNMYIIHDRLSSPSAPLQHFYFFFISMQCNCSHY